jgi:uncharacterized membrane protein
MTLVSTFTDQRPTELTRRSRRVGGAISAPGATPVGTRLYLPAMAVAVVTAVLIWLAVDELRAAGELGSVLASGWAELLAPMVGGLVIALMACERLWPAEPHPGCSEGCCVGSSCRQRPDGRGWPYSA